MVFYGKIIDLVRRFHLEPTATAPSFKIRVGEERREREKKKKMYVMIEMR